MRDCNELTYDAEADALFIGLKCEWATNENGFRTIGSGSVLVDVVDGELVGIEVLGASKHPVFWGLLPKMSGGTLKSYRHAHCASPGLREGK